MSNEKFKVKFGLAVGDTSATIDGTTGDIVTAGDLAVNGGDITTTAAGTANLFNNSVIDTVNIGNSVTTEVNIGGFATGQVQIKPTSIVGAQTTQNVFNTIATTVNAFGAATTVSIGANTGTTTINNSLVADDISVTTVDTTNLEVTNIKAKDGTAAAVIADSTGIITVSSQLNVDNLNISGNAITSTNTNGNVTLTANGTGDIQLQADAVVIGNNASSGIISSNGAYDLFLQTNSGTNSGSLTLSQGTNGNITLAPNGTGNVAVSANNGGNLTNTRNYLLGAVRDTTTLNNGNIYTLQSTISPTRGVSLSNSDAPSSYRPGIMLRSYSGGAVAPRSWIVYEHARGTVASPTAIQNNDKFAEIMVQGYNGTNWTGDQVLGTPFLLRAGATEAWAASPARAGTKFEVICQPAGVTYTAATPMNIIDHQPTAATYRADTWDFRTRTINGGGSNISQLSLDVNGNAILAGDLRINGNDIQASDGSINITLNGNSLTTFAGDIRVNGNDIQGSGGLRTLSMSSANTFTEIFGNDTNISNAAGTRYFNVANDGANHIAASVIQSRATNGNEFALTNFTTQRSADGINYTPTQINDVIGQFKFNGNANTSTTPGVPSGPGASITAVATENWSSTANGTQFNFAAIRTGTLLSYDVISGTPDQVALNASTIRFNDYTGTPIIGNNIVYNRVYGQWQNLNLITPAASNTAYAFALPTIDYTNIASVNTTSHIVPGAAGMYKLQFSVQVRNDDSSSEHIAYFWWRRNGTDVPNSMGQVGVPKAAGAGDALTIAGWDNMIQSTNSTDYWELMYAVDDAAHVDFPTFGTTAFGPATAALFVTLVPIGA